jgi:hypothetical protein
MEADTKPRDLEDRTFRFAAAVRVFVKQLPRTISNTEGVRSWCAHRDQSQPIGLKPMKR